MHDVQGYLSQLNVSRETSDRLERFVALLLKWNPAINLVSKSTLSDVWARHITDSAQLYPLAPSGFRHWADLGSGGGFPGIVIAIIAAEQAPQALVTLVDSDQRKATFLRQVMRELDLNGNVESERIEAMPPLGADVVSARALAPLDRLCDFSQRHLTPDGVALFLKGRTGEEEVAAARKQWVFKLTEIPSVTSADATICKLEGLVHA
jgi:16S rRNA (guanine527-N7)-methyltransferase